MTKTKIIATLGPASYSLETMFSLAKNGADFFRVNTKYGDQNFYQKVLNFTEKINQKRDLKKEIKIIWDILSINENDKINFIIEKSQNIIALSFAESSEQIKKLREKVPNSFIIAKIESKKGIKNFEKILSETNGIMIARGDLGQAVKLEKIPPLQKELTYKTTNVGKFLITATEMLISMVNNQQPTRAEVSDVANAVFDRSSALMLSEETAIGKYPVKSVTVMKKIITEAEKWMENTNLYCNIHTRRNF